MRGLRLLFVVLWIWPLTLTGQNSITGALVGSVFDPSGEAIPDVSITVRSLNTGSTREVTTNGQGNYEVDLLIPGDYEILAAKSGFSTQKLARVNVSVGQTQRADLSLKVGGRNETVVIDAIPASLNTENGSRSTVIESQEIQDLPLNGRNFLQLADEVPGAVVGNPKGDIVGTSFNGARSTYNAYQIDGANSNDPEQNTLTTTPPLDSIQEFQVETSTYSARYGGAGGAQISVITKSGGNQFHGTAYDYLRNKVLDALPYKFIGPRSTAPNYLFNQYGASVGGPVRRDHDFFFFNAEFFREKTPATRILTFSPNAAERSGDYTNSLNPFTGAPVQLFDPYAGGTPYSTPVLPTSRINKVGVALLNLWPMPNIPGADPNNNLQIYRAGTANFNRYVFRFDHKFNEKNLVYGTYNKDTTDNVSTGDTKYSDVDNLNHGFTVAGHYIRIFSPQLSSDLTGSVAYYTAGSNYAVADKNYGVAWGMDPSTNVINGSPWIVIFGQSIRFFSFGGYVPPRHQNHSFNIQENATWIRGNNSFQFGGSFGRQNYHWIYFSGMNQPYIGLLDGTPGLYGTFGSYGEPYADLLAALPDLNITYGGNGKYLPFLRNTTSAFLQDDWKVSRSLSLNLGVRWEFFQPFAVTNDEYETFDFNTGLPVFAKGAPGLENITFKYESNGPNTPYDPQYRDFAPRVGFAYKPYASGKTVIRGGYGIFFVAEDAATMEQGTFENPFGGATVAYPKAFFWPDGMDHYNTLDQPPYMMDVVRGRTVGEAIWNVRNSPNTYTQQFNLTVGQDLGKKLSLEMAYVGNHTVHSVNFMTLAQYDYPAQALLTKNIPGTGGNIFAKTGVGEFNSLQASLRRSLSQGLTFLAAYTWGHALATASNDTGISENAEADRLQNGGVPPPIRSNADYDLRHRFSISLDYRLPFGKGQAFANGGSRITNALIGGWSSAIIFSAQTGFPYSVFDGSHIRADQICSGRLPNQNADAWFDYKCFPTHTASTGTNPDGTTFQYNIQGNSRPNIIYGPHTTNLDFGLHKKFDLAESLKMEFRAEAFNLPNHPELLSPNSNYFVNTAAGATIVSARGLRDIQFALRVSF